MGITKLFSWYTQVFAERATFELPYFENAVQTFWCFSNDFHLHIWNPGTKKLFFWGAILVL